MSEFVDKVIGAEMEIHHVGLEPEEQDIELFIIDTVEEQDNGTYNVVSTDGSVINIATLEDIEHAVDGSAYYAINYNTYKKVFRPATKPVFMR